MMFHQNGTDHPLVAGVYSTRRKALIALEADEQSVLGRLQAGLRNPILPRVTSGSVRCQEIVLTGDAVDITQFPVPQYSPKDGGRYIAPGIVISKDPETGIPDIGKCERMGVVPQAVLVIGGDPVLGYTCQMQLSDTTNDWRFAGGIC